MKADSTSDTVSMVSTGAAIRSEGHKPAAGSAVAAACTNSSAGRCMCEARAAQSL